VDDDDDNIGGALLGRAVRHEIKIDMFDISIARLDMNY